MVASSLMRLLRVVLVNALSLMLFDSKELVIALGRLSLLNQR